MLENTINAIKTMKVMNFSASNLIPNQFRIFLNDNLYIIKNDRNNRSFLTSDNTLNFWYSGEERTPLYNRPRMNEGYAIFAVNRYKFIRNYCWQPGVPTGNRTPN